MGLFNKNEQHNSGGYNIQNNVDNSFHKTTFNYNGNGSSGNGSNDDNIGLMVATLLFLGGIFLKSYEIFSTWMDQWFIFILGSIILIKGLEVCLFWKRSHVKKYLWPNILESFILTLTLVAWQLQNRNQKVDFIINSATVNSWSLFINGSNDIRVVLVYAFLQMSSIVMISFLFVRYTWQSLIRGNIIKWQDNLYYLGPLFFMLFSHFLLYKFLNN